jgi:hypothetical protein
MAGAQEHILEELHQYRSTCYESWLEQSAWMHLRIWGGLYAGSGVWLVAEYSASYFGRSNSRMEQQHSSMEELHQYRSTCYESWLKQSAWT